MAKYNIHAGHNYKTLGAVGYFSETKETRAVKDKVISLGDIAMYTDAEEVPLHEVLTNLKNKENGAKASISTSAKPEELRKFFAEVLPNFDRERVYPSDIKKLISWYNLLIEAGITDFTPEEEPETTEETSQENI